MNDKILFIDATVRENSRTRILAKHLLSKINGDVKRIELASYPFNQINGEYIDKRTDFCKNKNFADPMFNNAKEFADSDVIVIAAPFWDGSFPASLKRYIEDICVSHITFEYSKEGVPQGLCKAKSLYYVTSVGGYADSHMFGYGYIKDLAMGMFGILNSHMFFAEGLDIYGSDVNAVLEKTKSDIDVHFAKH